MSFFPFVKDDYFDDSELKLIWGGLNKISDSNLFTPPENTFSAKINGKLLKKNSGYFLDKNKIEDVAIQKLYKTILKIFTGTTVEYSNIGMWESTILNTRFHDVLISYYENSDYYDKHTDDAIFTVFMWFYREPKFFSGGDLYLHDLNKKIEVKNNRILVIPSRSLHSVSEIEMGKCDTNNKLGRYAITMFLH